MFLRSLEMQGFKSFPDKTVLTFGPGMTAVVGPNGSGKSNISDAVRWVLGEQSTKNLRSSKMEEVIFNGTATRHEMGFAEVTLTLDNADRSLPYDDPEVSVTRRYYKSGESEYLINGTQVRLRDIHQLFMDTGLGRDGYSVVSQGRIGDIIEGKQNERREMLEEAAGISHFRYRREEALKRLSSAEENLVRLRDILAELETRVGPLKTQSEKAQKFLALSDEKKSVDISLVLRDLDENKEKQKKIDDLLTAANVQKDDASKALEDIENKINADSELTASINAQIDDIRHDNENLSEKTSAAESDIAVADNTILHNEENIARLKSEIEKGSSENAEAFDQIAQTEKNADELHAKAEEKRKELGQLLEQTEKLVSDSLEHEGTATLRSKELSDVSNELSSLRVAMSSDAASVSEIEARMNSDKERADDLGGQIQQTQTEYKEKQDALSQAEEKLTSLNNSLDGYKRRAASKAEKREQAAQSYEKASREKNACEQKIGMLLELERNMDGYQGSVKAVMAQSKNGQLAGIVGPVSSVITVSDRFSAAIETALGAALQNIITLTDNDAKRAVSYLKETKGGRATFLPLSTIKSRNFDEKGLSSCSGFIGMADTLVSSDKKYSDIISNLLSRTAVADDLDSAVSIAKKYSNRFRVVTLDGQVVNAGGSITGGSRAYSAGLLTRATQTEQLREKLRELTKAEETAMAAKKDAETEYSKAAAQSEGLQGDIINAGETRLKADSDLAMVKQKLDALISSKELLGKENEQSESRLSLLRTSSQENEKREKELSKKYDELRAGIDAMTSRKDEINTKKDELSQQCAGLDREILALSKDESAARSLASMLRQNASSAKERIDALQQDIKRTENENEQQAALKEKIKQKIAELKKNFAESSAKIDELSKKRDSISADDSALRTLEKGKTEELERLSGELARLEERSGTLLQEHDALVAKLYDEYQMSRSDAEGAYAPSTDAAADRKRLSSVKNSIRELGTVNVSAIEEYKEVSERYEFMNGQISDVETSKAEIEKLIKELTDNMSEKFLAQFNRISAEFKKSFSDLFGGGSGEISLSDPGDVLSCDIEIKIEPPGKKVINSSLFSGGEKGLAGIALLIALLKVTPSPFCIFDEVEAALDEVNVSRYAQYLRSMTKSTQFILITHRRGTMEQADTLYGITMPKGEQGVSKLLRLETAEMAEKLGLSQESEKK
jgi:chromosome segregation protein